MQPRTVILLLALGLLAGAPSVLAHRASAVGVLPQSVAAQATMTPSATASPTGLPSQASPTVTDTAGPPTPGTATATPTLPASSPTATATVTTTPACLSWSVVFSPNSPITGTNTLLAIDAVSDTDIWAVGSSGTTPQPLIEHWNGSIWTIVPSPSPGATTATLAG